MAPLIEARDLVKHFGSLKAVRGLSLEVDKGEVLGLLGPNGAGKSTTMKMLTGFLRPTSGDAFIAGINVNDDPIEAKRRFGYLSEGAPSYGDMRVLDFLRFIAEVRGVTKSDALERVIDAVHLYNVLGQSIDTLSKGFKRRVGLAQAIIHDPDVLILDEPTDGLDPNQKHDVRRLIETMAPNKAIIISTHLLEEVEAICTRAIIIDHGRIVADGTPDELKARSRFKGAVLLTLDKAVGADAKAAFEAMQGVEKVDITPLNAAHIRACLMTKDNNAMDTARAICRDKGWAIHEMAVDAGRLDDVFRTVTKGDEQELAA